jgi:hypothetical protein
VSTVLALSSDNYRLDWFTPLTGGGGGPAGRRGSGGCGLHVCGKRLEREERVK